MKPVSTTAYAIVPLPRLLRPSLIRRASTQSLHPRATAAPPATTTPRPVCHVYDIRDRHIPYSDAWNLQHRLVEAQKRDVTSPDSLIVLEHSPVYTLGTASDTCNVLFPTAEHHPSHTPPHADVPLIRTERGGEVTYHGPGQLVLYPILNLSRHKKDLHWYLRALEQLVIDVVAEHFGVQAVRKGGMTGVWIGDVKICAIGLKVSRWITMHGLALNVDMDLMPFKRIVPCGISTHGVSSLHLHTEDQVMLGHVRELLICAFDTTFGPYQFKQVQYDEAL